MTPEPEITPDLQSRGFDAELYARRLHTFNAFQSLGLERFTAIMTAIDGDDDQPGRVDC